MYPLKQHIQLSPEKWEKNARTQQVLMISNELNRAINCLKDGYPQDAEKCIERAFELIDLTSEDPRWISSLKEIRRFREVLAEVYLSKDIDQIRALLPTLLLFDVEAYNMLH
ncbi:MAG: hypothetical protein FJY10_00500 [Bacteroidetes bacterium]|nr:hypothetical protein [Bacteroidota bacterium]